MTRWFVPALLAFGLMCGALAATGAAAMALAPAATRQPLQATDLGARRHVPHHRRYVYRRSYRVYESDYYDRPRYYAPAPFFPFLGLGYGPWW